jgi:Tfp pilus assembly protein PilZ
MKQQIKLFSTNDDPRQLEAEINQWLILNENTNITHLSTAGSGDAALGGAYTVTILFERLEKAAVESEEAQRDHVRKDLLDIVDYTVQGNYYRDFIEDMSESGVFIRTSNSFSVGQEIIITFISPKMDRPFKIHGSIARVLPEGVGVKFKRESQIQDDLIRSFLK